MSSVQSNVNCSNKNMKSATDKSVKKMTFNSEITKVLENNLEYQVLPYQFFLLTFFGIWTPKSWPLSYKKIHKIYFIVIFSLDTLIWIEMFIHFISSLTNNTFRLINLFLVSANVTSIYKAVKIMQNREELRQFIRIYFGNYLMIPCNADEFKIYEEVDAKIRKVTSFYSVTMFGIVLLKAISPFIISGVITLPVDAWYPYSIEDSYWFWITYFHQVILGTSSISAHIAVDTLFVGLLLKISGQLDILKNRLENLSNSFKQSYQKSISFNEEHKSMIFKFINYHKYIYRFGDDLNYKFQDILIILVVSSLPNICINIYSLTAYKNEINVEYIAILFCTVAALLQFFITCWFGNEITLNSIKVRDAVYEMNWTTFDVSTQKLLIVIMTRALRPMQFSVGYIIPMNLNSFIKIIKLSYSAINLLQQTSK